MKKLTNRIKLILCALYLALSFLPGIFLSSPVSAASGALGFSMTPMKEKVILNPGESYQSSFTIFNPASNTNNFDYQVEVKPFFVDENYNNIFTEGNGYDEIVSWITIDSDLTGTLKPNQENKIYFTINVPKDAAAGGQYAAIVVSSANPTNAEMGSAILERTAIAHTVFAEVTGYTLRQGEVLGANVPSFVLGNKIYGESTIKNTGNVHGLAIYTLKVTPLFSDEEIYNSTTITDTAEEIPVSHDILPGRAYYNKITWEGTPVIGAFNVDYVADFEGVTTHISKLVIVCPIWLLIIVAIILAAIIIKIVIVVKSKKSAR